MLSVSASTQPRQYRPTRHWLRVKLQSLCSSAVGARARRRCAPPPSSRAALERCAAGPSGAPTPVSNRRCAEPTPPACQHRLQQPKGALGGESGPVVAAAPTRPRLGLEYWQGAPPLPAAGLGCPPRYVACGPSLSCRRRNLLAPFFGGLHRLAINNRRTECRYPARCLTNPDMESFMNLLLSFLPPPNPEVVVGQLLGRQVKR